MKVKSKARIDAPSRSRARQSLLSATLTGRSFRAARLKRGRTAGVFLLLADSHDHMPVFAEFKIGGDKLAYFALIQVLMLAAEFQSKDQRERLHKHYKWGQDLIDSLEGPFRPVHHCVQSSGERRLSRACL